jgi:hypothetical protein
MSRRREELARLQDLAREVKALNREANRARPQMSDDELLRRTNAAVAEASALGLSLDARDISRVEVL